MLHELSPSILLFLFLRAALSPQLRQMTSCLTAFTTDLNSPFDASGCPAREKLEHHICILVLFFFFFLRRKNSSYLERPHWAVLEETSTPRSPTSEAANSQEVR